MFFNTSVYTPLYFANAFVDQVQDAKLKFVDQFVPDETIGKNMKTFVEAQRAYTKELVTITNDISNYLVSSSKATIDNLAKTIKK